MNIEQKLLAAGGRPSGFDYMRLILACAVVCNHSVRVAYGLDANFALWDTPLRPLFKCILPMFFALSGFLVAGSLERTPTLRKFIWLRLIRIYPALSVEVLLSAFILGVLYTTVPWANYFTNSKFFLYLLNVTGNIHYFLPGVFEHNPDPNYVNVQLWTVPYELECYVALVLLSLLGLKKWRPLAALASFGGIPLLMAYHYFKSGTLWSDIGINDIPGTSLILCFLFGVTLYIYRDKVPYRPSIFMLCLLLSIGLYEIAGLGNFLAPPFIAYITIYLGLLTPKRIQLIRGADYSYGIYLYGYPIQQAFTALGAWTHHWLLNIAVCLPLAALFAALSWHLIEKPALAFKSRLPGSQN